MCRTCLCKNIVPHYLKICLRIFTLALCSHLFICRISAFMVKEASLIDFPYRSISSTANRSSLFSLLLFKTASNSLAFKLLTVSLYRLISGEIFIFSVYHRHPDGVYILLPYIAPVIYSSMQNSFATIVNFYFFYRHCKIDI